MALGTMNGKQVGVLPEQTESWILGSPVPPRLKASAVDAQGHRPPARHRIVTVTIRTIDGQVQSVTIVRSRHRATESQCPGTVHPEPGITSSGGHRPVGPSSYQLAEPSSLARGKVLETIPSKASFGR